MLVEKRIAGIIKWLERFSRSYSSGQIESALMDAECARADLEDLRNAVWLKVGRKVHTRPGVLARILGCVRTLSLAAIIVMTMVVPLSREVSAPSVEYDRAEVVLAEPIIIVREDEAEAFSHANHPHVKKPAPAKRKTTPAAATPPKRTPPKQESKPQTASVPYDKVYSLVQTGQRALKNNSSVIKIQ